MSSRCLTVSLVSAFLLAGPASRLVAQQPVWQAHAGSTSTHPLFIVPAD